MNNSFNQQPIILENVKKRIEEAEEDRKKHRLAYNLFQLEKGKIEVLRNFEFTKDVVARLQSDAFKNNEKRRMLDSLGQGAVSNEIEMRERVLIVYSLVVEWAIEHDEKEIIFILAEKSMQWLEFETELLPGLEVMIKRIAELAKWLLQGCYWQEAEDVVRRLALIRSAKLEKNPIITGLVTKSLETMTTREIVEKVTDGFLQDDENKKIFKSILVSLGEKSATYLINRVIHSPSRVERIALINLVPVFGNRLVPILNDVLQNNPPWAVIRNVIYIISEIADESHYPLIEKYFQNKDKRVQHEMICCVVKFGGAQMQKRLLAGLFSVRTSLKIHIIRILVEQGERDDATLSALCKLVKQKEHFVGKSGDDLLIAIIAALKYFPCEKAVNTLKKIRKNHVNRQGKEQILFQISSALSILEPQFRHSNKGSGQVQDKISFDGDPLQRQLAYKKVHLINKVINEVMKDGNVEQAGELLCNYAETAAKEKDFVTAEVLRDRLLEVNPAALAEVIQLGEFIEEHKSTSITGHHKEIWRELYGDMTSEQFNALYYALDQENYKKGDTIVRVGETDDRLYFLNSGAVSLACISGGREVFLKKMVPGDILGSDQFFSTSLWTVTLKAFSDVQVQVLEYEQMQRINKEFPGLESTLKAYCRKRDKVFELLQISGGDRRDAPRYPTVLMTNNVIFDAFGTQGKRSFIGELIDVSKAGLAFMIRISSRNNARLLLGRQINTSITIGDKELPQCCGLIVGVRSHDDIQRDFSIHVKLAEKMDQEMFNAILAARRESN